MADKYFIRKAGKLVHIYFESKGGCYANDTVDWMVSISRKQIWWNDHFVPDIESMRLTLDVFDNFDRHYNAAQKDEFPKTYKL